MLKIFKRFLHFCQKENRNKFILSIFLAFINSLFDGLKLLAIYVFFMDAFHEGVTKMTGIKCLVIMLISVLGASVIRYISTMLQTEAGYGTCALKRMEIAEHLRYVPMGYFNDNTIGQVLSVATNTMQYLEGLATRIVMLISSSILTTVVITLFIIGFDWRIGLILVAGLILFFLVNNYMINRSSALAPEKQEAEEELVSEVMEYIDGINEVKSYNLVGSKSESLNKAIRKQANSYTKMEATFTPIVALESAVVKLTGVVMIFVSIMLYLNGSMPVEKALLMIIGSFIVFSALEGSGAYSALLRTIDICVTKGDAIMESPQMNLDGECEKPVSYDIEVKNVEFSYENKKIINNISFNIKEGSKTAIVGPSGGGKTTITKLISRFFDVDKGEILIGGKSVKDYSYDTLMSSFSFVFQNVYLFKDTIANNIRFGRPEASMDEVIEVAREANCDEFIKALPNGYDTVIGEDGVNLSGGERQRLSIARAMMKDSPIIVLDEATANIDPENECELMEALAKLTKGKTIIMIAHRLKSVQDADQILVIDNGRLVEAGTHNALINENGLYKRFIEGREKAVSWKISE